jgi:hypothetical protein
MNIILKQYIPAIGWLGGYDRWDLSNDLTAGIILNLAEVKGSAMIVSTKPI